MRVCYLTNRQVMNVEFLLVSVIIFSGIYVLACCIFCLCDKSCRGPVLYQIHK